MQLKWELETSLILSCRGYRLAKTQNWWQRNDFLHSLLLMSLPATPTFCWNQNETLVLKIDKQVFVYRHCNVDDVFIAFIQTEEYTSQLCSFDRDEIQCMHVLMALKQAVKNMFPELYRKEEEWSAPGTQQQDFLIECFDNVRAPSRLLCEVLLNNLVLEHCTGNDQCTFQ